MSDSDPEQRPTLQPLGYRAVEDDRKPGEAWKVLAFMGGMIVGLFACTIAGGICVAGVASSSSSRGLGVIAILIGLIFLGLGVGAIVVAVRVGRERRRNAAFLLGLLCGACTACLLEGFCFTAIGISS